MAALVISENGVNNNKNIDNPLFIFYSVTLANTQINDTTTDGSNNTSMHFYTKSNYTSTLSEDFTVDFINGILNGVCG